MNDDQNIPLSDTDPMCSIDNSGKIVTTQTLPEIEVFLHINFNFKTETIKLEPGEKERHPLRYKLRTTFNVDLKGHPLDKNISSIIVYSGHWQFFDSEGTSLSPILGPGHYARVADIGIANDKISSFKITKAKKIG